MLKLDDKFLELVGLGDLAVDHKKAVLQQAYKTIEMRVGITLAGRMNDAQLDEFEQYFNAKDDKGAFLWLEQNFPDYKRIVNETYDHLKAEMIADQREVRIALEELAPILVPAEPGIERADVSEGER